MKKTFTFNLLKTWKIIKTCPGLLIFSLLLVQTNFVNAQWIRKSDALRKRAECPSILYHGKIYVFGGFGEHPNFEKDNEVYDPALDSWTLIASFPVGKELSHQEVVLVDDKIWHIGGREVDARGPVSSMVLIYDITNNVWFDGPQLKDPATGQPLPIGAGGAVLLGRTLHYFGGFAPTICIDQSSYHLTLDVDKWLANPQTTTWENKLAPLPTPRNHLASLTLAGKIYAIGGQFSHDCGGVDQKFCHVYDPITDTWTRLTDLPSPRSHAEAATLAVDGKIYFIGGQGPSSVAQNTVLMFTPEDNNGLGSWSTATQYQLPNTYYGISAKVIGDTLIISHGALAVITDERIETYTTTFARNIPYKLGFTVACFSKAVVSNQKTVLNNFLYTIESETQYNLTSNAAWLTITKNATGIVGTSAVDIEATIDAAGLAAGNYTGIITATGIGAPVFASATFCVNLTVTATGYTLNVTANGNGTVTKNPNQATYASGTSVTLTATPAAGQQFTGWSGDASGTVNPLTVIMNNNKVISANFSQTSSFIVSNITSTTGRSYTLGQLVVGTTVYTDRTYTATTVPANLNNAPCIKTPNDDKANTTASVFSFNINQNATVYVGYDPRATVLPAWLSSWQILTGQQVGINDPKISYLQLYSKSYNAGTVSLGGNLQSPAAGAQNNYLVIAQPQAAAVQYNLTVSVSGNGSVAKNPNQTSYASGTSVILTATPAAGQQFTGWSGSATGATNPLTITMDADKSVTATFAPIQYTLTVTTSGNGSVTKNPNQATYASGSSVALTATPAAGQQFTGWSGAATGTTNPLTITMDADKSVTATFAPIAAQYTLTVTTSGNGSVTKNPNQATYASGSSVALTATPAAGQQFTGWSGAATGTTNPLTITMDADKSVTATFAAIAAQYTLTVTTNGNGSVTKNPNQANYASGTSVTLTATPAAGQQFTGWGGDASGTANPLTVTMNSNKAISANFSQATSFTISNITSTTGRVYTLGQLVVNTTIYTDRTYVATTVPANLNNAPCIKTPNDDKANTTASVFSFSINQNATVYIGYDPRATVLPAWLSSWQKLTGQQVGINDPKISYLQLYSKSYNAGTVSLGGNLQSPAAGAQNNYLVIAQPQAAAVQYNLTVSVSGNGSVAKNPNQTSYASGTSVILTATPAAGQQFTGWSGAATGTANPLTITMDADKSVTATFAPIQYTLTVTTSGNGSVSKNPSQATYASGTSVILTATPAAGQQFTGWSGAATGTTNPLTITMDADKSVTATFAPIQYTLTVTTSGNGSVTKNPNQATYASGTSVTLTATPAAGQQFTGWSGDASGTVNPLTVTMNSSKAINANFSPATAFTISNITSTTGRVYTLGQLVVNTTIYTDRTYVATTVPANLNNAPCIKTPNDDKANTTASVFSFSINQNATVYVGYDPRATVLPAWLSSWQKLTGQQVGINDPKITNLQLYSKSYNAGTVSLGGNLQSPAAGVQSNYFVIVQPQQQLQRGTNNSFTESNGGNVIVEAASQVTISGSKNSSLQFKIYPNPNPGDKIHIEANNFSKHEMVTITLQDVRGSVIESMKGITDELGTFSGDMLTKHIGKGLYIINVISISKNVQGKMVIN